MAKKKIDPKSVLRRPYEFVLVPDPEEGGYSARIAEFPGCFAEGDTPDEALSNLLGVAESWILDAVDSGMEIPEPVESYSGRIALRLPADLHRTASREAARQGTSLNQFLVSAVAYSVGYSDARRTMMESVREFGENLVSELKS